MDAGGFALFIVLVAVVISWFFYFTAIYFAIKKNNISGYLSAISISLHQIAHPHGNNDGNYRSPSSNRPPPPPDPSDYRNTSGR